MYGYRYINKHVQFGQTNFSLILEDLEDQMPDVRVEKSFSIDSTLLDEDFLYNQAKIEIANAIQAYQDSLIALEQNSSDQGDS